MQDSRRPGETPSHTHIPRRRPEQPRPAASGAARSRPAGEPAPAPARAPSPKASRPPRADAAWETVATLGIVALALGSRLFGLAWQPLQPEEAANAWQSWSMVRGEGASASAGPLLIHGNALLFFLFGGNDLIARLLPALAGSALVALPLLLQRELGRLGSRAAMLLLAVSPSLVYSSRQADPAILAAGAALALVACATAARWAGPPLLYAAAAAAALLLVSGPLSFFAVFSLASYLLLRSALGGSRPAPSATPSRVGIAAPAWPELAGAAVLPPALRERGILVRAGLAFGLTWLLVTTGFLASLHGVQEGVADGLAGWLRSFGASSGRPTLFYGTLLATYELPALVFGLAGAVYFARPGAGRGSVFAGLLTWWALAGFFLGSFGAERPPALAPQLVVPLALLAGALVDRLGAILAEPRSRRDLGWLTLGATVLLAGLGIALNHLSTPDPLVPDYVLAAPVTAIAGGLAVAVATLGRQRAPRLLALDGFAVLLLLAWRASALLSYQVPANTAELFAGYATSPDVRALAGDVAEVVDVLAINRKDRNVAVAAELAQPLLWYLRDVRGVSLAEAPASRPPITILPGESKAPAGGYAGERYRVGAATKLELKTWEELWRWLAFREGAGSVRGSEAVVYVRTTGGR